jgi:lysozyme family protein
MDSFAEYKDAYENNWAQMEIRSSRLQESCNQANILLHGKPTYQQIESKTGVPWWFVGLCHYRESNFNFDTYLGNGQSLVRMTTIVPKGRGPFTGPDVAPPGVHRRQRLGDREDALSARGIQRLRIPRQGREFSVPLRWFYPLRCAGGQG